MSEIRGNRIAWRGQAATTLSLNMELSLDASHLSFVTCFLQMTKDQ